MKLNPVTNQKLGALRHDLLSKRNNTYPGQNKKTDFIDYVVQTLFSCFQIPPNKRHPDASFPDSKSSSQIKHDMPIKVDQVLKVRAYN